ncbi:glutamine cyclotransferase [Patiriisocius marinistellae]|uniref:Glutamine cyclotransferase n=1 Tax=Patiriisocius marinistellae TaxID=2494560 RepID=A0A5J4FWP5_9FLAO|nr:glutaminyl-peptide cyclotransferase [Patiriisocius marinistellae]GEQ86620.1 glutamine cyclotransferase [Patiriisocius marinistellae]
MKFANLLIVFVLLLLITSCDEEIKNPNQHFSIEIKDNKKSFTTSETVAITLISKKGKPIDNVSYSLDENPFDGKTSGASLNISAEKLGERTINATITSEGNDYTISKPFTILSSVKPKLYGYRVLEVYPHDQEAYTQGLEFEGEDLYESTGQRGFSDLRKTNYKTGEVLIDNDLKPQFFGEGLTILNDKLYQLTWQAGQGIVYDFPSLKQNTTFKYNKSKEGWGLANDGTKIYKSDGTEKIWTLNPNTLAEEDYIEIYTNTSKVKSVNELEWIEGKIFANVYQSEAIAIVDPANGAVTGIINMKGLKEKVTQHNQLDVLNGIAYKGEPNIIYVTGKKWDKLFKIEIFEK